MGAAAIVKTILPELLRAFAEYRMLVYSVVLVLVMIFRPQGIFGSWEFSLPQLVNRLLLRNPKAAVQERAASEVEPDTSGESAAAKKEA